MKLVKWMCLVAACIIAVPAFGKRKVPLHEKWMTPKKSIDPDIPIETSVEETTGELTLEFTENLGDVVVTVTDASGKTVYPKIPFNTISIENKLSNVLKY